MSTVLPTCMSHLFMYVCVFTGDVPPTPLSPFEPHSTAIFSPTLRFTVKMERGVAILTKATDSLTPQVRGMMGGWEGKMGGRWRGGGWKVLGGQNRQLRRYKLTCVACVTLNCGVRLQYASCGGRCPLSRMSSIL